LPILVKGILTAEDAVQAAAAGVEGIIVSTHGGRQLDRVVPSLRALPEVVAAAGDCEVLVDGGIRRGVDVLTALALGARAVLVGRPIMWGLTVGGAAGVTGVLHQLATELADDMVLAGRGRLADIDQSVVLRD
jgi:4-hydroxymandelate oxidase